MSGLLIAAPSSGSGKTTVTLGLMRALKKRGVAIAPGKAGPDYIDPAFHAAATGEPCFNYDPWAMRPELLLANASQAAAGDRTLIVEAEDQCGYHATGRSAAFYLESYGGAEVAKLTLASRQFLGSPPADFSERGFLRTRGDLHITRDELPDLPPAVQTRVVERAELE